VRELAQAGQRLGRELRQKLDACLLAAPEIVLRMRPGRPHMADRLELDMHVFSSGSRGRAV